MAAGVHLNSPETDERVLPHETQSSQARCATGVISGKGTGSPSSSSNANKVRREKPPDITSSLRYLVIFEGVVQASMVRYGPGIISSPLFLVLAS